MKNKKIVITLLIMLILILTRATNVFAADIFSASLTPDSTKVSKGDTVTVTFNISNINVEGGGLSAISATLKYDSDVLSISSDDIEASGDWAVTYNEDNGKLVFDKSEASSDDEEVAQMTFTVSSTTSATTATIQLLSIAGANSSSSEEVTISDITTNISISSSLVTTSSSTTPSTSSSATPSNSPSNDTTANDADESNGSSTANDTLAYTGAKEYILPLIIALAVLAIISFVNYRKLSNK